MPLFPNRPQKEGPLLAAEPDEARKVQVRTEQIAMVMQPRGQIAEQFRSLRNSIIALNPEGAPRSIVMTSALRGEGKSVATINLAIAMAEIQGARILLLDADLHHPSIERYLGLPRRQGLVELVRGTCPIDRAVRPTSIPNVSLLGPGELPHNPSELLGTDRVTTVLGQLKQRFSYILIDTPEALTISDAAQLGSLADGIVLVVRLGSTARHHVEQTYNTLETMGGNVLGTCLTSARIEDTSAHYAERA
ncbi:MAG: CpsD/CapB family tyrosine-protein kinase [Planctomycetota bacterium]|nr:CpsD/CapB family tyrosine-protein kinase [Planctomycetota bacterium]